MLKLQTVEKLTFKRSSSIIGNDDKGKQEERYRSPKTIINEGFDEPDNRVTIVKIEATAVAATQNGDTININGKYNGNNVDSGRESMSSNNAAALLEQDQQPKVKVVGELLKKDVQTSNDPNPIAPLEPILNGGIDLSSLIIAKDIVIGSPTFGTGVKSDAARMVPKKKPVPADSMGMRKKRIQRVSEHVETKQKVVSLLNKKNVTTSNEEKPTATISTEPAKTIVANKKLPMLRSNSKDSVNGVVTQTMATSTSTMTGDKSKKKLIAKLSLDSKTKEQVSPVYQQKKPLDVLPNKNGAMKVDNVDRKKLLNKSGVTNYSSPKIKANGNCKIGRNRSDERATKNGDAEVNSVVYHELYNAAVNRKFNSDCADNSSFFKDISEIFPSVVNKDFLQNGYSSGVPILDGRFNESQVI